MSEGSINHRSILEQIPKELILINNSGHIRFMNNKARQLFDGKDLSGQLIIDYLSIVGYNEFSVFKQAIKENFQGELMLFDAKRAFSFTAYFSENDNIDSDICILLLHSIDDVLPSIIQELSENKLRAIINNISDIITLVDAKGVILFESKSITATLGYDQEELIGRNIFEFIHPEDIDSIIQTFAQHVSGESNKPIRYRFLSKNGSYVHLESVGSNQLDNPTINAVIVNSKDVTELVKADQSLIDNFKELSDYKFVLDQSSIVAITNTKGFITYVNDTFCRISKYSVDELIGKDHRIINSGYHPKSFFKELWATILSGIVWRGEIKNKAKDGTYYWVDTTIVPFLDKAGKPYQYMAIRFDITERKKIEEQSNLLISAISNANDSIIITDTGEKDGIHKIVYANKAFSKMTGYSLDEIIGYSPTILQGELTDRYELDRMRKSIKEWQPCEVEILNYKKNGEPFWNNFSIHPVANEKGWYTHWIAIEKDVTERKKSEEALKKQTDELARSNAELEQFAYVASHDLQEPLRMITGFLSQLDKKYSDQLDEKAKKYIFFANDGAIRMRQIILDLLDYSRAGRINETRENVDLNQLLNEVIRLNARKIHDTNAVVEYDHLPTLFTSRVPLLQLFQNLLSNAIKYHKSDTPPFVKIKSRDEGTHWGFSVSDNGIGMQKQYHEKIFVIFQRLHNRDEYSGTGIGLAICKKIIDNFEGKIWLESEEGKGTTFYFTISKALVTEK